MTYIHVYEGSQSATVIDMTNAHKVGKVCRVLRVQGSYHRSSPELIAAEHGTVQILAELREMSADRDFDDVRAFVLAEIEKARAKGAPVWALSASDEEMKAIRAPREVLTAGVEGKWTASADASGISMMQLDDINQWREITIRQTPTQAYKIAAKVWPQVQQAATLREAREILSNAGAKLHGYCGMD